MAASDFDKAYLMAQKCVQVDALRLFEHESCKAEDLELKRIATKAIPTLQDHVKMAFELAGVKAKCQSFARLRNMPNK
jgi:predicted outer membrane protein